MTDTDDIRRGAIAEIYRKSNRQLAQEVDALRALVRELLTEFIDSTTMNLILANRPEIKKIMEEKE